MGELRKNTVLVVDDNESTRYLLGRALKAAGYEVWEASSGQEALRLAERKPDLITLDINLPDVNGIEVCRRIKESPALQSVPVIQISATFVRSLDKALALDSGADGYLTHPVEDVVLVATVGAFVRARRAEKERERLLKQSQRDLENLQDERELREKFVAALTHDLRTPLTAAKMSAQFILRQPGISDATQKLVGRIRDSIDRADGMIRDLLDANRIRAGEMLPVSIQECDLRETVEAVIGELGSTHGDRFVLLGPKQIVGWWDCEALKRVFENLLGNAIKYGIERAPVVISLDEDTEHVRISVHNQGKPISSDEQARIFKPYGRTASAIQSGQKGWGLGLTLVRGMVEAHGGSVSVESSAANGTVFIVVLPRNAGTLRSIARDRGV